MFNGPAADTVMTDSDPGAAAPLCALNSPPNKMFIPFFEQSSPTFNSISETWKERFEELPKDPTYQFPESILNACKTPEDVIFLLRDENFISKLSSLQLIQLVAVHPFIASSLYKSNGFVEKKSKISQPPEVMALGYGNPVTAQYIIDEKGLESTSSLPADRDDLIQIAASHESVAKSLLSLNRTKLTGAELAILGCNFVSVAKDILNTPYLREKLNEADLATLGSKCKAIKLMVLVSAETISFSNFNLAKLCLTDITLPTPPLEIIALLTKLNAEELVNIAKLSNSACEYIYYNHILWAKIPPYRQRELIGKVPKISRQIAQDPQLTQAMSWREVEELIEKDRVAAESYCNLYRDDEDKENRLIELGSIAVSFGLNILKAAVAKGQCKHLIFAMALSRVELAIYFAEHPVLHAKFKDSLHQFADFPIVVAILNKTYGPAIFAERGASQASLEKFKARIVLETTIQELAHEWIYIQQSKIGPPIVSNFVEFTLKSVATSDQALTLLQDKAFLDQLSLQQFYQLISLQPEPFEQFLKTDVGNKAGVPFSKLTRLDLNILKFVINNKAQLDLNNWDLIDIVLKNEKAAEYLLNHANFSKATGGQIAKLSANFIGLAQKILGNPELCQKFSDEDFATLGCQQPAIKDLVIKYSTGVQFSNYNLAKLHVTDLAAVNPPVSVVRMYELLEKELFKLGLEFPLVAKYIFETRDLAHELKLTRTHSILELCSLLGSLPELSRKFAQLDLCLHDIVIRKEAGPLIALSRNDTKTAQHLWDNAKSKELLLQKNNAQFLVQFVAPHPTIALSVLQDSQFNQHLSSRMLAQLANCQVGLALYLVQRPSLRIRLEAQDLAMLTQYPIVAAYLQNLYGKELPAPIAKAIERHSLIYKTALQVIPSKEKAAAFRP